jgi:TetR/AcrR family transcriptional regulator, transcriptional repressor for nem operon
MVWSHRGVDMTARPCSAWPGAPVFAFPATQALRGLPDWIVCSTMAEVFWTVKAIRIAILLEMSSSSDRPRLTRKGAATRARIVDAAAALIYQQGVARTTIEEVRDGAHVSSSQLYHYFDDKPALVRAVIDRQADRAIGTQEHFDLSSLDGLREWRDFVVDHARSTDGRGGCPIGSIGSALAETEPEARAVVVASFKRWEASIMAGLLRMHALGRLAPEADPRQLALALLAALQGGLLLAQIRRDPEPLAAALDAMLMLIGTLSSTTGTSLDR